MEIKKGKQKIIIDMAIFLILLFAAEAVAYEFKNRTFNVCDRVELTLELKEMDSGLYLNARDMNVLEDSIGNTAVAYLGDVSGKAGCEGKYEKVCITASNEYVFDYFPLKIVKGTFLTQRHRKNGSRVAVISKNLAAKLFMSCDIIGRDIYINGDTHRIVGVYDEIVAPVSLFSLDDLERIFVPFESNTKYADIPVNTVFLKGDPGKEYDAGFFAGMMGKKYHPKLLAYRIKDYGRSSGFISQFVKLDFLIIGLSLLFLILRKLINTIKTLYVNISKSLAESYLPDAIRAQRKAIVLCLVKVTMLMICILAICFAVRFTPIVSARYVPEDNIFDLDFYFTKFKEYIRDENSRNFFPTAFSICFKTALAYVLFLSAFIVLQWARVFKKIR